MLSMWLLVLCSQAVSHLSTHVGTAVAHAVAAGSMVAIDLGSMPRMGFVPDAAGFADALYEALVVTRLRGLILTGAGTHSAIGHC